jgi:hypothetical protein
MRKYKLYRKLCGGIWIKMQDKETGYTWWTNHNVYDKGCAIILAKEEY